MASLTPGFWAAALPFLALLLVLLAAGLLWLGRRKRRQSGLPVGRVVYDDSRAWSKVETPLFDPALNLTGKPDYIVEREGGWIPVEVKSSFAPSIPRDSHIYQLACYCLLVERTSGKRPPYGILHYRNRTFAIDYTPTLEKELLETLAEIRLSERGGEVLRSHQQEQRCAACGYRRTCPQRL